MFGFRQLAVVVTLLLSACVVFGAASRTEGGAVVLNGMTVLRFRASAGNSSPANRALAVSKRLSACDASSEIAIRQVGDDREVLSDLRPLFTVTHADAVWAKTNVAGLAIDWSDRIRRALRLPALYSDVERVVLPVGWTRRIALLGSRATSAAVEIERPEVAKVDIRQGVLTITSRAVGSTIATVRAGDESLDVEVVVRPFAADLPQTVTAWVTGAPAFGSSVNGAVQTALGGDLHGVDGVRWTFGEIPNVQLRAGISKTLAVRATASAPGAITCTGVANVRVQNAVIQPPQSTALWYSNNPESVATPQSLFAARLQVGKSVRLLYHHMNSGSQPMFFRAQMVNDSDTPARVWICPGDATPQGNPLSAGAQAASQYLHAWMFGSGEIVTIPPRSAIPISLRRVSPKETLSGLCGLRLLEGPSDVLVRTDAYPPFSIEGRWVAAIRSGAPWRQTGAVPMNDYDLAGLELSPHIYPEALRPVQKWSYNVGGRHQYIRIGERAISRQDTTNTLDGNFGVIYRLEVDLLNPTAQTATVGLQFVPSAGATVGLFVLDGKLLRSPLLVPPSVWRLAKVRLAPGARRTLNIQTVPISGGNYPATLQVGAIDEAQP